MDVIVMYRPVNGAELALVQASGSKKWPPRLPEQPIFYPVTNEKYACEIAERWNVKDFGEGYVTRFAVQKSFMDNYQIQQVGDVYHTEWWIPAEDLEKFNAHIVGEIEVIKAFKGA